MTRTAPNVTRVRDCHGDVHLTSTIVPAHDAMTHLIDEHRDAIRPWPNSHLYERMPDARDGTRIYAAMRRHEWQSWHIVVMP